jgi:hypothetical protein
MLFNNKGAGIAGVMIAAAIGLIVIAGISKALINFSGQTAKTIRANEIARFKENMVRRLTDIDSWKISKKKFGGKIPGEDLGLTLYNGDGTGPWVCRRKGGGLSEGIAILDKKGQPQTLNCSRCLSDKFCGMSPEKFNPVLLDATTKGELIPSYKLAFHDTSGTKTLQKFEATSANEKLYDEEQMTCQPDEFLRMVVNGKPVCEKKDVLLWNKTCPNDWQYLYGFNNQGRPLCDDIRPYINSEITRYNNNFANPAINKVIRKVNRTGSEATSKIKKVGITTKYRKITGKNDKECAHKNTMRCPNGYMMIAYEALQPTHGSHCSIQCRKLVP